LRGRADAGRFASARGWGPRRRLHVSFDAAADLRQLGLLAALWRYGEEELVDLPLTSPYAPVGVAPPSDRRAWPHLVVVQSESFFDVRRLFSGIRSDVLREFDDLQASARWHGQLAVSAWGANTVRTEFAFLSGLAAESLAVHRFNPYRRLARQGMATLAGFLRDAATAPSAYIPMRQASIRATRSTRNSASTSSSTFAALPARRRAGLMSATSVSPSASVPCWQFLDEQPLFVFVITMENHGPLHLEKVHAAGDSRTLLFDAAACRLR
jgi:hypothetical protein